MKLKFPLFCQAAALVAGAFFAPPARAELDYEFAKALIERDEPSFDTDDLVEHLVSQLDQKAESKMDAKLIKATLRVRQALTASVEKRKNLLDEAETLYRDILAGDKKYKHYDVAEKEAATINSKRATTMIRAAQELEKTNPAEARKMRQEAVATMEKIAAGAKGIADEKFAKLKPNYDKYKEWNEKVNTTGDKAIPPEILKPLGMTFDDWLLADKRYVATKIEQLECYDDSDGAKKTTGAEIAKLCKARSEDPMLGDFPVIVAWYNYMLGRTYSAIQDEKQAGEAWNEALTVDTGEMAPPQKKAMFILKKSILHDLIKMKMKAKKYSDVEGIVVEALVDPGLRTLFEEDAGKELLIDYAKALTLPSDATAAEYEKAIKKLREQIAIETKGGAISRWANEYSRTIAELLDDAKKNKPNAKPKLSAPEWYDAARGFFLMGQQEYLKYNEISKDDTAKKKEAFERAYTEYQNAVDLYRRAIAEARKPKTDLLTRVTIEPKSWFEMALCYLKMEHYYESVIAYQAMRDSYLPESRKKWMPDVDKVPELRKIAKAVKDTVNELDKAPDGLNIKSGKNIVFALDKNMEVHKNKDDFWNKKLKAGIMSTDNIDVGDSKLNDPQYQLAKVDMELAKSFVDSAKTIKDVKQAEDIYTQAEQKYLSAASKFVAVKPGTPAYELAMYQAGSAYTMVQALWATGRFPARMAETKKQCEDMAKKAVAAFDKYDNVLKTVKAENDDDKTRREKLAGTILLARNALHSGAGEWEQVIKTADEYVAWEADAMAKGQMTKSSADVALLNKFRGQLEMASDVQGGTGIVPKCDPYLAGAEQTMRAWRKEKPKENKTYVFMLNALSRRNNNAAFQVEKFVKEGKSEFKPEMADKYENKVADLQSERVEMIEEAEGEEPTMDDYSRLVYLFNKTRRDKKCADICKKLLDTFDKEKKNVRIPDDEKVWQEKLAKMVSVIRYSELNKDGRCKKDHGVLIDYMYDTTAGVNAAKIEQRPENDKYNSDMERARIQLETIKKNYPDCQTLDPKFGEGGKSLMQIVEEEIDFRRKIMATRELLFEKAIKVATSYEKENNADQAKHYKEMAFEQLDTLIAIKGETPELMTMKSNIAISIGNLAEALDTLNKVRIDADPESVVFFDASKKVSEVYALQKKWREAAEYPEFLGLTIGFDARRVRERWADMKVFLKECYDNGAPMPATMKKIFEDADKPEGEKKPDEKKPEGEKKEEPKADEKKADEKKPADAKPEDKKDEKKEEPKKDDAKDK